VATTRPWTPTEKAAVAAIREANAALREAHEAIELVSGLLGIKPHSERPELELVKTEGGDA
jgi:hypothetical protein